MIEKGELPADALLQKYVRSGAYTDCYSTHTPVAVSLADFVSAFYTTWLFKLERFILRVAVSRPSTDAEARSDDQLLMCDFQGRTRSWFMVAGTRLYFGSAVVPVTVTESKVRFLLGLHRLYSRALLHAARSRLQSPAFRRA